MRNYLICFTVLILLFIFLTKIAESDRNIFLLLRNELHHQNESDGDDEDHAEEYIHSQMRSTRKKNWIQTKKLKHKNR